MSVLWTAFALFAIPAVGAFIGFDLAFRVTAYRTREIVLRELDADAAWSNGPAPMDELVRQRERRATCREEAIRTGCREDLRHG